MIIPAVENDVLPASFKGKIHSLHTEHNIFQRRIPVRHFRVGHVGVDDDEIVPADRVPAVLDQIDALSALDIAQFRKVVGMDKAGPVVFEF